MYCRIAGKADSLTFCVIVALILALASSSPGFAQLSTATLLGTITDQSGAVTPGAAITIKNLDTGIARNVLANEAGRASGTILFDLTISTAVFAVAFSTILGMVAGIVPAWSAARLDPVQALRHQ